jgi:hypothetical protein
MRIEIGTIIQCGTTISIILVSGTDGLPFKNSFDFILTPTPPMLGSIGRKLLISRAQKTQHA